MKTGGFKFKVEIENWDGSIHHKWTLVAKENKAQAKWDAIWERLKKQYQVVRLMNEKIYIVEYKPL